MPVGTSLGQWFPDRFSHATQKYATQDKNVVTPNDMRTNKELDKAEMDETGIPISYKMPFPDNKNPDTDFNNRYQGFSSSGSLTDEDLQKAGLRFRGVDDRTNETMLDQLAANANALKVWGHNLIHPDPAEPLPAKTSMAEDLGIDNIKPDAELLTHSDMKLMYDTVVNDALATGRIFTGMYESLRKGDWRDSPNLSQPPDEPEKY